MLVILLLIALIIFRSRKEVDLHTEEIRRIDRQWERECRHYRQSNVGHYIMPSGEW